MPSKVIKVTLATDSGPWEVLLPKRIEHENDLWVATVEELGLLCSGGTSKDAFARMKEVFQFHMEHFQKDATQIKKYLEQRGIPASPKSTVMNVHGITTPAR